jgi:5'-methylthioadenosine phosphorylase
VVPRLAGRKQVCPGGCDRVLDTAIVTAPDARDPALVERLKPILGRVL